jgi:outer membrane protein assembly factor BamB
MPDTHAFRARLLAGLALLALAGCQNREEILPGAREAIRPEASAISRAERAPLALPPPVVNAAWPQRNGATEGRFTHLAFAPDPRLVWSVDIGEGSSRRARLIAAPVVAQGLVFTMDAAAQLSAVTPQGATAWRRSVAPAGQRPDAALGGGVAEAGGVLYVATGFGEVMALDPATGGEIWRVMLDAPVRSAPAVADGRVVVVARNDTAYALSAATGELLWRVQGAGGVGVLGGSSAALDGNLAVVPFVSGEVLGLLARNGLQVWAAALTGGRRELVRNRIGDITGGPVIAGDTVYASNQSGRTVSVDRETGARNWTIAEGAFGPVWPVGGSVFLLSDQGALVRATRRRARPSGPRGCPSTSTRAGGRRSPITGRCSPGDGCGWRARTGCCGPSARATARSSGPSRCPGAPRPRPALARGVMYVVTRDGRLHAFQ